ncbi:jerky protein homolog-like [Gigantopelta aegis]|uniref:jerky protein homolog-like n=1 Tax=Gigantopelta aegis TaxID=1735272 RepID=UPI001B88CA81|nr:jerky protein homolog-like [Gigantopelta aegis]
MDEQRTVCTLFNKHEHHDETTEKKNLAPHGQCIPKKLSNIKIHFLPPTTTSHLQPLDAGIIQAFKGQYRRMQLQRLVQCIDNNKTGKDLQLPLSDGIRFVKHAWDIVSATTIKNCWIHTGVVPRDPHTDFHQEPANEMTALRDLVGDVTGRLSIDEQLRMDFDEFVNIDNEAETFANISNEQILESVNKIHNETTDDQEEESDAEPEPIPSAVSARDVMNMAVMTAQTSALKIDAKSGNLIESTVFGVENCTTSHRIPIL